MFKASDYGITIAETQPFIKGASEALTDDEREKLINFIALRPDAGDIIPGTGGVRKLRWPAKSQGKRAGARILYFFHDLNMPVYLLAIYTKNERIDFSGSERKQMRKKTVELVETHCRNRAAHIQALA
jgi:hypothetical protein